MCAASISANSHEFEGDAEILQTSKISAALVDGNALWDTVGANGSFERPSCSGRIAVLRQHEYKGLTVAINCTVQICPCATHLDVGGAYFTTQRFSMAWSTSAMVFSGLRYETP